MTEKWTRKRCFDFYGVVPKNPRWSWSGRSPYGKVVAVTFWKDEFENGGRTYRLDPAKRKGKWIGSPAHN